MSTKPLMISIAILLAYSCVLIWLAFDYMNVIQILGWLIAGILGYSLIEYFIHRYIFHLKGSSEGAKKLQYSIHGNHHHHPDEKTEVMIKPVYALALNGIITLIFYIPLGNKSFAFIPGFMLGYSFYLGIHQAYHVLRPPKNFLKQLWKHHYLHHYYNEEKNYGVSSPFWDMVFGTRITAKEKSTCKTEQSS